MSLRNLNPGDPLPTKATTWNAMLGAARDYQARPAGGVPAASGSGVLVKNNSGSQVERFGVLGLDGPLIAPADNLPFFKSRVALVGVNPTHADHFGKFAVCQEPIGPERLGRARIIGLTVCKINMKSESHEYADVRDANATTLDSASSGTAKILSVESGTGEKWGIVQLGVTAPPALMVVKEVFNDYLKCRRYDGVSEQAADIMVAKPCKLRHNRDNYPNVSALATVGVGEVNVTVNSESETWELPTEVVYAVGDHIYAEYAGLTGVQDGSDNDVAWIDLNVDGRHWIIKD